jgi:hypothetical protein
VLLAAIAEENTVRTGAKLKGCDGFPCHPNAVAMLLPNRYQTVTKGVDHP